MIVGVGAPETELPHLDVHPASGRFDREQAIDHRFSLVRHVGQTGLLATAICALGVWLAWGADPWVWLGVPIFWVIANLFEWGIHKFPMHRPLRPRVMYRNHSLIHHRAFAGTDQEIASTRELCLVMMPWYTLALVFTSAAPVAVAIGLIGGTGLAGAFLVSAVAYFLFYELIHTLHHLPLIKLQRAGLARRPLLALREHHHYHHQLENMAHTNFNVTIPLADRLLGTYNRRRP
jgi:hypothetical protein